MAEEGILSMKPAVEFFGILEQYSYNDDLNCSYKCNTYKPQEGDRIAIFKLGWSFVKDYVVFEWAAPVDVSTPHYSVVFNKHILPKNTMDLYQICYISGENEVQAATSTFQFVSDEPSSKLVLPKGGLTFAITTEATQPISKQNEVEDKEIRRLREDNELLRESLKAVIAQKKVDTCKNQNYDKDIRDLWGVVEALKMQLNLQHKELNTLKMKIIEGGEEYKKLYLEKIHVEKKYEKLKSKKTAEGKILNTASSTNDKFEISDLESMPPFPFNK